MLVFYRLLTVFLIFEFLFYSFKFFKNNSSSRTVYTILLISILGFLTFMSSVNQVRGFSAYTSFCMVSCVNFCVLILNFLILSDNLIVESSVVLKMKLFYISLFTLGLSLFFALNPSKEIFLASEEPYKDLGKALVVYAATFNKISLPIFPLVQLIVSFFTLFFSIKYNAIKKQPILLYVIVFSTSFLEFAFCFTTKEFQNLDTVEQSSNFLIAFLLVLSSFYLPILNYQPSSGKLFIINSIKLWKNSKSRSDDQKILNIIKVYRTRERISKVEFAYYEITILGNIKDIKLLNRQLKEN